MRRQVVPPEAKAKTPGIPCQPRAVRSCPPQALRRTCAAEPENNDPNPCRRVRSPSPARRRTESYTAAPSRKHTLARAAP